MVSLHSTNGISPQYGWYPSIVLMVSLHITDSIPSHYWWYSSKVLMLSLHSTDDIPPAVHSTEHPQQYFTDVEKRGSFYVRNNIMLVLISLSISTTIFDLDSQKHPHQLQRLFQLWMHQTGCYQKPLARLEIRWRSIQCVIQLWRFFQSGKNSNGIEIYGFEKILRKRYILCF